MKKRANEPVLLRGFYLRLLRRWYLLPAMALLGAVLGAAVYFCVHVVFAPMREYAAGARLYLEFSPDAAGNARDYYNAWTWKELVTADDILGDVMNTLADAGLASEAQRDGSAPGADGSTVKKEDDELVLVSGKETADGLLTRAMVLESMTVRLPSDLRVMMLTVTNRDAATADAICDAMCQALIRFGEKNENFSAIRVLETTPALLVVTDDRTPRAIVFGAVCGLLVAVFCLYLFYALDDALYDPEMCGRRFALPELGVLTGGAKGEKALQAAKEFERELRAACVKNLEGRQEVAVLAVVDDAKESDRVCQALTEILTEHFMDGACRIHAISSAACAESDGQKRPDAVILAVPAAKRVSARADHLLSVLASQEIPVAGTLLYDADLSYLIRLYG